MDFSALRAEGIAHAQELAGKIWTDYNAHDPGVTLLEALCYAITDLGYRTSFDLPDILHYGEKKYQKETEQKTGLPSDRIDTLYSASEILPCHPLTPTDYRKLLIDHIPQLQNAWFVPITDDRQGIRGLYRVLLQIDETAYGQEESIQNKVKQLLAKHRNLCEDIAEIKILQGERITIVAKIGLMPEAIGEEVLAQIIDALENTLSPPVDFHTLDEMLASGLEMDEVFACPPPIQGFIKSAELLPPPSEINIPKLIKIIGSIKGVRNIQKFLVYHEDQLVRGDMVILGEDAFPFLDIDPTRMPDQNYPIKFVRGTMNYDLDQEMVHQIYGSLVAGNKDIKGTNIVKRHTVLHPFLKNPIRNLEKYHSLQHDLPPIYGVGKYGLSMSAPRYKHGRAKQLKAYLLFFEQLLADYLAQLANTYHLFSIDSQLQQSYFSQFPEDIPNIEPVLKNANQADFETHLTAFV
ncbi:MAG: hypothetical protein ACPGXL_09305, partial [Chitinophagales bacterium]